MKYTEAVDYIEETPKFTTKNSLDHTRECLRRLGNPQDAFQVIHVAGTNGKGSVCAYIASVLREGGYKCGLFTSPHLIKINERFQIDEVPVSDEQFLSAFEKVKKVADDLVAEGSYHPTYFEMLFLMGMILFADAGVDYVALETGLGGRMDATNSIGNPMISVITSISMDHVQYLGDTIAAIAGEKAGIIKPQIPVVYDANREESRRVIEDTAMEKGSAAYGIVCEDSRIVKRTPEGIWFTADNPYYEGMTFKTPFAADYQVMNASLALKAMEVLKDRIKLSREQIQNGIAHTRWQGRMETVLPGVIVDGAHNEDGVRQFVETAVGFQKKYPITILFSAVSDKEYEDMIANICEKLQVHTVITTQIQGDRVVSAKTLAEVFRARGCTNVIACEEIADAFEEGYRRKGKGLLFCVGSLYLVGEIKDYIARRNAND